MSHILWFLYLFTDAASAEQQKPTGMKQEVEEEEEDDIAIEMEEEQDLQAVEAKELKPEKQDDNNASKKGEIHTFNHTNKVCLGTCIHVYFFNNVNVV